MVIYHTCFFYSAAKRIQISPVAEHYVLNLPLFSLKPAAMLITDIDIRRKTMLLLPLCVVRTLKTKPSALERYLMGDTFRKSY